MGGPEFNKRQIEENGGTYGADDLDFNELYEILRECQDLYIDYMVGVNKSKVEFAFSNLKFRMRVEAGQSGILHSEPLPEEE